MTTSPAIPVDREPAVRRAEIPLVLQQLKRRIQRYVLLEGAAYLLVILSLFFWVSLTVDFSFSVLFMLELTQGVRFAILVVLIGIVAAGFFVWILLRCLRSYPAEALALVLERRFPELKDRLITSVQLADGWSSASQLTEAMLRQAVDDAVDIVGRLKLDEVFDFRSLHRASLVALLLAVSIAGFATAYPDVFGVWYRRNVIVADEYWPREVEIYLAVVDASNDQLKEFRDGVYKHARGADLTLLAGIPQGKKVPDHVRLSYDFRNRHGGGSSYFSKLGTSQFRLTINSFRESASLTVYGGDYFNRTPYVVEVVDPPEIDRVVLQCKYPQYTKLNDVDEQTGEVLRSPILVQGTHVTLPVGTDLIMRATCNKPLQAVRIQTAEFTFAFDADSAELTLPSSTEQPDRTVSVPTTTYGPFLNADGMGFAIPMVIGSSDQPHMLSHDGTVLLPLVLTTECSQLIYLTDRDGVTGGEPARLNISAIIDETPIVETMSRGIRSSITRQATIPVEGRITDDYGVTEARFDFKIDQQQQFRPRRFAQPAHQDVQLEVSERFDVLSLHLDLDQKLTLTVFAEDGDDLNGPHAVRSEPSLFQIVSKDELLSLINARELDLRRRFEQILREVQDMRHSLLAHQTDLEASAAIRHSPPPDGSEAPDSETFAKVEVMVKTAAQRALLGIRKSANETLAITEAFTDIRDELVNNAVHTQRMLERIESGIIKPLNLLGAIHYNNVDESLGLFKLALDKEQLDKEQAPFSRLKVCVQEFDRTIEQMERVLSAMLKLETMNQAMELLRSILRSQDELREKTKTRRKKKLIEGLQ